MDPFIKRVKTQAEKDALLKQARDEWHKLGEFQFLVASSDEEYVNNIAEMIEVEQSPFEPPRQLSAAELEKQSADLLHLQIFGNRRTDAGDLPPVLQKIADEQESADLEKLLAPARRQQSELDSMIEAALARLSQKGGVSSLPSSGIIPKPIPERVGNLPILKATVEFSENPDFVRFITAYAQGDEAGMRAVARELAAA